MFRIAYGLAVFLVAAPAFGQPAAIGGANIPADSPCLGELRQVAPHMDRPMERADRTALFQMRDTAIILAQRGNEETCQLVAREMLRIAQGMPAPADVPRAGVAGERAMMDRGPIHLRELIDAEVRTRDDEEVGEVYDVVVVPGQPTGIYALVDRDQSWIGATQDLVAVPLHALRATDDDELIVDMSEEAFNELPALDDPQAADVTRYQEVDRNWGPMGR